MTDNENSCGLCGHDKIEVVYKTTVKRAAGEARKFLVCIDCDLNGSEPCPGRR
jgi:hypothetical protein